MGFEDVIGRVSQWGTATAALAALGAELSLLQPDAEASPEVVAALRAVSETAGLAGLDELAPPQQATLMGVIRLYLHSAVELLDNVGKPPGWTFTDPAILDGYGRGSAMLPGLIAGAHPDLADVRSFLDVGTGVGLLAVAAANVWPNATVVGIDPWQPSLDRAAMNIKGAGLDDRITLRAETLADIDEVEAFDCIWIPTFFFSEDRLAQGVEVAHRALRPGGWVVLGRDRLPPDPLTAATAALRWVRSGGSSIETEQATAVLGAAGFVDAHPAALPGPIPVELVLGQRPA